MPPLTREIPSLARLANAHFIGVGGVGMSAIAQALLARGVPLSGCDARESDTTRLLRRLGAVVEIGHGPAHIATAASLVISSAIAPDNPELQAARARGLPVWHRSQALGALMEAGDAIGIAGAHGKTTTTLMTGAVLTAAGLDPTVLVGGWVPEYGGGARVGRGAAVVAEVDESDGSFLNLRPNLALITNIDFDHPDHFANREQVHREFVEYVNQTPPGAVVIADGDDEGVRAVAARFERRLLRCRLEPAAGGHAGSDDLFARVIEHGGRGSRFAVWRGGAALGEAALRVGGLHNVRNALLAIAAGLERGATFDACRAGLAEFRGVRRRFEPIGEAGGVRVFDDYAHHPRELAATLAVAARLREQEGGRVLALFQPHRFSRTQAFVADFGGAFAQADVIFLTDIYSAGEAPIAGVSGRTIADAVGGAGGRPDRRYHETLGELLDAVAAEARPGDIVLTLGAGDITTLGPRLLARLGGAPRQDG